ncbi:MAG: AI-2E family transporter [Desulfopila sp.]
MKETIFVSLPPPWDRIIPRLTMILVWGLLFATIYLLRSFFLLIFLTFVFSYIQIGGVTKLKKYIQNRIIRVVLVAVMNLLLLCMVGIFLVPKVKTQTQLFVSEFGTYLRRVDKELLELSLRYPLIGDVIPELQVAPQDQKAEAGQTKESYSPTGDLIQQVLKIDEATRGVENVNHLLGAVGNIGGKIAAITSSFLLSLLFSFLILLDLPRLTRSVKRLENTKLRFVYICVADTIRDFSVVLGRALEAQLLIAMINSVLTALGITILGLGPHVAFLSVIVFFCSFIPVVGVFISSIPICLIALQSSGVKTMLLAIILITIIHLIEGYILNPRVYGSYMRMNPVIVLIILTIGGKLFGFWGLLLGVPVCTYVLDHAIQLEKKKADQPSKSVSGRKEQKKSSF